MTPTEVKTTRDLPAIPLRCYQLTKNYTEADALEDYQERYRETPTEGWRWGSYLYLPAKEKE